MKPLKFTQPLVSVSWLSEHLDHPDLIVLDATIKKVTSTKEAKSANLQIKNARFFDIKKAFSDTTTDIPNMLPTPEAFSEACRNIGISNHHKIVVYDQLGIYSSPRVWWMFKTMGHENIAVLDGGLPAWKGANMPCETMDNSSNPTERGDFKAMFDQDLTTDSKSILAEMNNKNTLILDARSPGRFTAQEPEPRASLKGGHIPNSMNLHYTKIVRDGHLLPVGELKEVLDDFNIENKKLIFTCGSGITACIIMLAANLAGYDNVSVYDGSWSEWGQLDGVPIAC
ncbi:sulfurtransferase [Aquimarina sp. 2304DJ70-9]|uniref:sulfurtransferase n=1 Tax=Aquimarina penaris TaxID=3231044 RepID=UPI003462AB99